MSGKTTLVKVLMDMLEPTTGVVERDHGARVALVNQHHADQINLDLTPLHWMHTQAMPDTNSQKSFPYYSCYIKVTIERAF